MAATADATDKDIQDALAAVGAGAAPETGGGDADIDAALQAINVPKPRYTPDKGPADFMAGSYDYAAPAARRAVGGAVGEYNTLASFPGMVIGGLAAGPAAGLHKLFPDLMPTGQQALEEGEDLFQIHPGGDYGEGAAVTEQGASYPFQKLTEAGGNLAAQAATQPLRLHGQPPLPTRQRGQPSASPGPVPSAQDARTEAFMRSGGEAITQAILALGGMKLGGDAVAEAPRGTKASDVVDIQQKVQPGAQPGTSTAIQPTTDFAERMAAAAPKPVPKPVKGEAVPNPELEALAGQYRAQAADVPATLPQLPKYLKGAKPKMGEQAITFASDLDKAAYIVANPRTASARHADYLEWLAKAMDTDENTALFMAKRSRDATVASVKAGKADIPPFLSPKKAAGEASVSGFEPEPTQTASVPLMITKKMRAGLLDKGFTPAQISKMTPQQAHDALGSVQAQTGPTSPLEQRMGAVDEALKGTALSRVNIPIGAEGFAQENHLRMGQGEGTPLGYTQFVQDVYEHPADEVLQAIGEQVFQQGKGDPTRVHLDAPTLTALQQALAARGWNPARRDRLEMLSAAYDYAMRNRQVRNEGYARMRGAIQDNDLMGEMLRSPENFAVRVRLPKFDAGRDFEKVCAP